MPNLGDMAECAQAQPQFCRMGELFPGRHSILKRVLGILSGLFCLSVALQGISSYCLPGKDAFHMWRGLCPGYRSVK